MKKNIKDMQNPAGDMMLEIQEQDLAAPVGGAAEGGDDQNALPILTALTALTAWSHDHLTKRLKCGAVLTASAECNGGTPCN